MAELTIGERRVRTKFNPSQDTTVDQIKQKTAELINLIEDLRFAGGIVKPKEVQRLIKKAQTKYENAAMWAEKAATFEQT